MLILRFPIPQPLVCLFIAFATIAFIACSNSEPVGGDIEETASIHCRDTNITIPPPPNEPIKTNSTKIDSSNFSEGTALKATVPDINSTETQEIVCDTIQNNLPLNDTEYPYAGIPRIVIETENHRAVKNRETEIPARLQIWGEKAPESEIMELTIRGRGNSSWFSMAKKSYTIELSYKHEILGMPTNRDWALISNYADKTLMRNYLIYKIAPTVGAAYAPRCVQTELYLNGEYLGVYLLTETIKIGKNRVTYIFFRKFL